MKELVEVIAKALVDNPDEVIVTETENERAIVLELRVAQSDMGKVIGKQGRIAKAIRSVVKAAASKEDKKVVVEIMQQPVWECRKTLPFFACGDFAGKSCYESCVGRFGKYRALADTYLKHSFF